MDPCLYCVEEGEIILCRENRFSNPMVRLNTGAYFGELSFFGDELPKFSAVSTKFTTVFALSKKDFLSVVKERKTDYVIQN